mmetsp:Transcript_17735/g.47877  ORF Transcript_17735/g.47877 Transcript_17735/m.47877 type:complete len:87 (+) Transcript_17735:566-826(+)
MILQKVLVWEGPWSAQIRGGSSLGAGLPAERSKMFARRCCRDFMDVVHPVCTSKSSDPLLWVSNFRPEAFDTDPWIPRVANENYVF